MSKRFHTAAALSAAAAFFALSLPASAHVSGIPTVSVIDRVSPAIGGMRVTIVTSVAPALDLVNATGQTITITAEGGEPLARIKPNGVDINSASPTAYRSADPFEFHRMPATANANAPATWKATSTGKSWRWFDPRIRAPKPGEPHGTTKSLRSWSIPIKVGDEPASIEGHVEQLGAHGHLKTFIDSIAPADKNLTATILEGTIPALFVTNRTGLELAVPGQDGEPFLRFTPQGVMANTRSPTYFLAANSAPQLVPASAAPDAPPRWTKISDGVSWAWLEYRTRRPQDAQPSNLGTEQRTVIRWSAPFTLGGEPGSIVGHVDWIPVGATVAPPTQRSKSRTALFAGLAGAAALITGIAARRMRAKR